MYFKMIWDSLAVTARPTIVDQKESSTIQNLDEICFFFHAKNNMQIDSEASMYYTTVMEWQMVKNRFSSFNLT